jgi:uncharacterized membrane protein YphA (DoxX/SURF4 family)/peroxiredoxin
VELALLVARLLLAAVFFLAGVSKLADRKGAGKALTDFGLPPALAHPLSWLLSVTEIAVAVALVPLALAWYGACAALTLLIIFVIVVAINLARGRSTDCHCFGQLHSAPVGRSTLIRNGILGGLAGWLVYRGPMGDGPSFWRHLASAGDNERRLFIVAGVILCFVFLRALRQKDEDPVEDLATDDEQTAPPPAPMAQPHNPELERILEAGTGWPIGTQAPDFTLPDITGQKCSLQSLRGQGRTICLVFSSPHCDPCRALWPYLRRWVEEQDHVLNIIVISRGTTTENLAKQNQIDASRVLLQQEFEWSYAYGVTSTPAAVLVGVDGLIQSRLAVGREQIHEVIVPSTKIAKAQAQLESSS